MEIKEESKDFRLNISLVEEEEEEEAIPQTTWQPKIGTVCRKTFSTGQ